MKIKTIKNIDEETWKKFKYLAVESNINMADLLRIMINEFKKNSKEKWDKILNSKAKLSKEEAEEMSKILEHSRKERGFRE